MKGTFFGTGGASLGAEKGDGFLLHREEKREQTTLNLGSKPNVSDDEDLVGHRRRCEAIYKSPSPAQGF